MNNKKQNLLVLCTGNSARSQMAEGFFKKYASDRFDVYSAGLTPKGLNPFAIRAMDEVGIDISNHTSDRIKKYMGHKHFRYVITVCSDADEKCPSPLWSNGIKLHWPFEDPATFEGDDGGTMAKFREVRDKIDVAIKDWLENLDK